MKDLFAPPASNEIAERRLVKYAECLRGNHDWLQNYAVSVEEAEQRKMLIWSPSGWVCSICGLARATLTAINTPYEKQHLRSLCSPE